MFTHMEMKDRKVEVLSLNDNIVFCEIFIMHLSKMSNNSYFALNGNNDTSLSTHYSQRYFLHSWKDYNCGIYCQIGAHFYYYLQNSWAKFVNFYGPAWHKASK
ncbi:unnamed protein product [Hydatigera taeniaeformis]|uniref:Uncharacterized protein n=1 Tax=Hydatigena taeniaeformis TaxID=6205 RepID=A0A0R3X8G3_HYDTA|nr:unnamed protein product [Hydatigera taeniaeformis]